MPDTYVPPRARHPGSTLASTLAIQTLATLVLTTPPVLAPAVAPALGIGPERVGYFIGIAYLAAMLAGLFTGALAARWGEVRVSQLAMLACALGAAGLVAGPALVYVAAALVIGVGYGVINPAATALLARHAPPANRGLFMSIKQTGVPLGVAASGLAMPWGLVAIGWQPSVLAAALLCAALALALHPLAARLDDPGARTPVSARVRINPLPGMLAVMRDPVLRRLSLASFAYAFTQLCFTTFLVSYLKLELGRSLALAASILAGSQLVSVTSRIALGHVADRWADPGRLLGVLGVAMALACLALAALADSATTGLVIAVSLVCAATMMGWNGVFFAELTRCSGRADLASVAGASQFFTFFGSMTGPVFFAEVVRHGGTYGLGYLLLAALPALAGASMLIAARRGGRDR
jgi:MFS family permease